MFILFFLKKIWIPVKVFFSYTSWELNNLSLVIKQAFCFKLLLVFLIAGTFF